MCTVVVAGERTLVLHQRTEQATRRRINRHRREAGLLPVPSSSSAAVGAVICGPMPNLHAVGLEQEDVEQIEIADASAVATVRIGAGADRHRCAQQCGTPMKSLGAIGKVPRSRASLVCRLLSNSFGV
jgi:hypothetical protein